jgi:hypothetical protein
MEKKILAVGLGTLLLAGVYGVSKVDADEANGLPPVAEKLVERFNLNEDEVEGVFDEALQEHQQQMQEQRRAEMEERLDEAVNDGVITSDQKQALLDKQAEMQERQQQLQDDWQQWREQSGIDFEALAPYHIGCGGKGFGGRGHPFGGF